MNIFFLLFILFIFTCENNAILLEESLSLASFKLQFPYEAEVNMRENEIERVRTGENEIERGGEQYNHPLTWTDVIEMYSCCYYCCCCCCCAFGSTFIVDYCCTFLFPFIFKAFSSSLCLSFFFCFLNRQQILFTFYFFFISFHLLSISFLIVVFSLWFCIIYIPFDDELHFTFSVLL